MGSRKLKLLQDVIREIKQQRACREYKRKIIAGEPVEKWLKCKFSFDEIHQYLINKINPEKVVIFDVGAHHGESIDRFHNIFPDAVIHAFEPEESAFLMLQEKYGNDNRVILNNYGIGSFNGEVEFYKNAKSDTSGCIPVNISSSWATIKAEQLGVEKSRLIESAIQIPIKSLDMYIEENGIDKISILKLDTQGYEDECLKGGQELLKANRIDIIESELIVGNPYEKTLSFLEIESCIHPFGYRFFAINKAGNLLAQPHQPFDLIYLSGSVKKRFGL